MTVDEAKEELKEYRDNIGYIREKQEDEEELREVLVRTTTRFSKTKTSSNNIYTDRFSNGLDKINEIEKEWIEKLKELLNKKFVIDEKIEKLKYPFRDVLFMRYARGKNWQLISDDLGFESSRHVFRIHGKALQMYAEL